MCFRRGKFLPADGMGGVRIEFSGGELGVLAGAEHQLELELRRHPQGKIPSPGSCCTPPFVAWAFPRVTRSAEERGGGDEGAFGMSLQSVSKKDEDENWYF